MPRDVGISKLPYHAGELGTYAHSLPCFEEHIEIIIKQLKLRLAGWHSSSLFGRSDDLVLGILGGCVDWRVLRNLQFLEGFEDISGVIRAGCRCYWLYGKLIFLVKRVTANSTKCTTQASEQISMFR